MKIFLTGASGFIGKHLVKSLQSSGHEITLLVLPHEKVQFCSSINICRGDITQFDSLKGKTKGQDIVIHLAGAVGYGQKFNICEKINILGTENMALEAINSGVKRFIHMSSVAVYGRQSKGEICEETSFLKIGDPYGDTKIEAELKLKSLESKLDITYIRPTVIYGEGDDKFLPKLMKNISGGKVNIIGDGTNRVDLIHIDDVVKFFELILQNKNSYSQAYNLTNAQNETWNELLSLVMNSMGINSKVKHIPYPVAYLTAGVFETVSKITQKEPKLTRYAVRVVGKKYNFVTNKSREQLGFTPQVGLKEGFLPLLNKYRSEKTC